MRCRLSFRIARKMHAPHNARMFVFGGDAFPNDTQGLHAALTRGAIKHGAGEGAVTIDGNFPSLESIRMNLTGVHIDGQVPPEPAPENTSGGFFARVADVIAEPALLGTVPVQVHLQAKDCVFAFGIASTGMRAAWLQTCETGTLDAEAAAADLETAVLGLAREAAAKHGAEVESVRLTLVAENPRRIAVTAVAVAKAMFFTAKLTISGRITIDDACDLRLSESTCTGDGMIANLAAAQLRPRLAGFEQRAFSIRSFLPHGLQPLELALSGGSTLKIHAAIGRAAPEGGTGGAAS